MVTIYNVTSGEAKTLDYVDAREHVATGRWAFGLPEPEPQAQIVDPASPEAYDERLNAFNTAMQEGEATPQAQAVARASRKK